MESSVGSCGEKAVPEPASELGLGGGEVQQQLLEKRRAKRQNAKIHYNGFSNSGK